MPLAYAFDALTIWQLYAVGFLVGVGTVFFDVAYQSYLPSLVDRAQLVDGNSKLEISRSAAALAGPGLAGVLIGALTAPYAILLDAVSFLGSAGLIARIGRAEHVPEPTEKPSMRRELVEGLRYLLGHPFWRPLALTVALSNFFNTLAFSIFLVYAVRDLDLSATVIGLALGIGNVGWLLGAVAANRLSARLGVGRTLVGSALVFGPAFLLVPAAPQSHPIPFLVAALILAVRGDRVQRHRPQLPTGGYARSPARTPERDEKVHRVGRDPARLARRRCAGLDHRAPVDALGRRDRRVALLPAPSALARPLDRPHGGRGPPTCARDRRSDRCLSSPRSRPGCASSLRSSPRPRSSAQARPTSRR